MRVLSERGNRKLVEPEVLDLLHLGVHGGIEGSECQLDHKHRDEKPCIDPNEKQVDEAKKYDQLVIAVSCSPLAR